MTHGCSVFVFERVAAAHGNRTATKAEAQCPLADRGGMTRFEPPQVPQQLSDDDALPNAVVRRRPQPLPSISGLSVRRVIGTDGQLDRPLPWASGTPVEISIAGAHDA